MSFSYKLLVLFCMIFCHLIDDYKIQGILANMKQREWWRKNCSLPLYENDYKIALIEHAFSWSFTITIPFIISAILYQNSLLVTLLIISYIFNTIIHAFVDDLKANQMKINLITDQLLHLIQIFITWILMIKLI